MWQNSKLLNLTKAFLLPPTVSNDALRGATPQAAAQVLQWVSFADSEIIPPASAWVFPTLGIMQFNKQVCASSFSGEIEVTFGDRDGKWFSRPEFNILIWLHFKYSVFQMTQFFAFVIHLGNRAGQGGCEEGPCSAEPTPEHPHFPCWREDQPCWHYCGLLHALAL